MKTLNRIISVLLVALILTASIPYVSVSAADSKTETYTLTIENTYEKSYCAQNSAIGGFSFFGNTVYSDCYGNQLSDVAKELYDSLVSYYADNKNTDEYTHTFDTAFTFNAKVSGGSIVMNDELEEISLILQYAMQIAMDAFLYDHPEVFWLYIFDTSYSISASGNAATGYKGRVDELEITPIEIYSGASSKVSQYNREVDSAVSEIPVTESRYDTLKNVHDYICDNAYYKLKGDQRIYSCEPFFIGDGGFVCEGYAKTFKVLCDELEIPCVLVGGDAGGPHMWNYVQMDDSKWYLVDATWDDQDDEIYDTYFIANSSTIGFDGVTISEERSESADFSETGYFSFTYPVLSTTEYTAHTHEWEDAYTVDKEPTYTQYGSKSKHCTVEGCEAKTDVTSIARLVLGTVQNLKATSKDTAITLTWDKVDGASGYRIFRYDNGWKTVTTTGATSCTVIGLTAGTGYKFAVRAYSKDGSAVVWAPKYPTISTATAPLAPKTVKQSAGTSTSVTIKWTASTNATGYRVYLYNASTKKWETAVKATANLTATVSGLSANRQYYLAVRPYTKTDSGYVWATTYTKILVGTAPATPTIRLASTATGRVTIVWSNVSGETGYQVYYSTNATSGYKKLSNYNADVVKAYKTGLTSGTTYYFRVRSYRAYNGIYVYSPFSTVQSVTIK